MVSSVMSAMVGAMDSMCDEDKRLFMHYLLDSVQLHEKRQADGWWVKSLRFKVVIKIGEQEFQEAEVVDTNSLSNVNHDETVVSLSLKKDTPKIEIPMRTEEDSLYEPKDKGMYRKIKAYILEKYGLKVSSHYIA